MLELSPEQNEALSELLDFEKSGDNTFLLNGSAGTGKTTLLGAYARDSRKQIILSAPTHKAANVLAKKCPGYETATIHSLLGLIIEYDKGNYILVQKNKPRTGNSLYIIIVDEASMLDKELMDYIKVDIKNKRNKYIFVGDHCQLMMEDGSLSEVFTSCDRSFTLDKIIRQAEGSPIINVCTGFRDIINTGVINDIDFNTNEIGSVSEIDKTELINISKKLFLSEEYKQSQDFVKILSYTNEASLKYNNFINKIFKVPEGEQFIIGSKIVFNSAFSKNKKLAVPNNAEGTITGLKKNVKDGLFYYTINVTFDIYVEGHNPNTTYDVISECSRQVYKTKLNELKRMALTTKNWAQYYYFQEMFADIRLSFAQTVHKSQGSTYEYVIIDLHDIMKASKPLVWHLLYVAVSRASKGVYILS